MTDREWLIWYRNWLCHEHNARLVVSTQRVVDAIDEHLGVSGMRKADQELTDVGRMTKEQVREIRDICEPNKPPQWFRQKFWRCKHYPSAIDNYFATRTVCDYGCCHESELKWHHSGTRQDA